MHGNRVISLGLPREAWLQARPSPGVGQDAVYGCVDWYLYHDQTLASSSPAALPQQVRESASPTTDRAGSQSLG
jgi:hypothetical protein